MRRLDETDLRILHELQGDGRISNQELADRVGLSPSPCLRRVRRLEEAGVVAGYTAVVDPASVGLDITAFVRLRLDSHSTGVVERVEEAIRGVPEVTEAYLLAGDHDYLLKVAARSFPAYEELMRSKLRSIPSVSSIETTFAISVTKPGSPLPVD
ncbi:MULTISPECIES: Lrp/AsnC family transcriptional regulator [unclassified Nocardiopsis]|uniref:Lrp/AsnC family transcriptional regulator n=1 Tax=unclassified Nocardiopsis TaxID=2649073 RepID=UPI0033EBFBAD